MLQTQKRGQETDSPGSPGTVLSLETGAIKRPLQGPVCPWAFLLPLPVATGSPCVCGWGWQSGEPPAHFQ